MAYFTLAELQARTAIHFPPIGSGDVTQTIYDDVEPRSRSYVESYLTGRYGVPFTTVPQRVKDLTLDYGSALVADQKFGRQNPAWGEKIQFLMADVLIALKDLARGIAQIDHESGAVIDEDSETQTLCSRTTDDTVFTLDDETTDAVGSVSSW